MTNPQHDGRVAALRAWAAVAVRQAQQLLPHARKNPRLAVVRFAIEHLTTVERLLPPDDPARAAVVPWLGLLMKAWLGGRPQAEPAELAAVLGHLRWTDRARPLNDRLAMQARTALAELLVPAEIPPEARDGSGPPELVDSLRARLTEALNVFARIVAGNLATREVVLPAMERVAAQLSALPGPPENIPPAPPLGEVEAAETLTPAMPRDEPSGEALAAAVRQVADLAGRDGVWCMRLLAWLCDTANRTRVTEAVVERELADLGLDQPVLTPLRELLAALGSDGRNLRALTARVGGVARAVRETLLALPAEAPERIRLAKLHAALLVRGNLLMPESLDFSEVDAAVTRPDPDPEARETWPGKVSAEWYLNIMIDNLWGANGGIDHLERSVAWLRQSIDTLPAKGRRAATTRRYLSSLLAQRVATAVRLEGSLQDGVAALALAEGLSAADERDNIVAMLSLIAGYQVARRGQDQAAMARLTEEQIKRLTDWYATPSPDAGVRVTITGGLGHAYRDRASRTGDPADRAAAARYLREAVEIDPATVPPLYAPFYPVVRAQLMIALAGVDPRREVVDRATAEVHGVIEESRMFRREEGRLRLELGRAMLLATTHRSDLSLLDPCIAELNRARALVAEGHGPPLHAEVLIELSKAHWTSAMTGGGHASEDRKASRALRREALEVMAVDVLRQLGAEHALSVARATTGEALWLALRCAEDRRPAEAVEALELGRALVLRTAAAAPGVPRLLADRGHSDLAERWRTQAPRHPLGPEGVAVVADPSPGAELPGSLRRRALAALGVGGGTGARELLGTPDIAALSAALAASGADALVYLVPGEGFRPHIPGRALVLRPGDAEPTVLALPLLLSPGSHQLERYLAASADRTRLASAEDASSASREAAEKEWQAALGDLCDWAWAAAVGPVLDSLEPLGRPPRVVLIPCGPLGVVPWHAARLRVLLGGDRYACQDAVFSYAPSGAQFVKAAARDRLPTAGPRVLVTDPRLSLAWAEIETEALRAGCYPDARRYGEFVAAEGEPDAPGSCADLLDVLPGGGRPAAVLHVSCHGVAGPSPTRSALSLADGELTVARILDHAEAAAPGPDGPLVVLSACETDLSTGDHDEALTLSTALVARGAADVVGSRWAVRDGATALMMAVFHHFLSDRGLSDRGLSDRGRTEPGLAPADALRAAQLWMLDPDRRPPPGLDDPLRGEAARTDLDRIHLWAAFTHQGNPAASSAR
ncbi:CHAT domain-containing protein [Streptomyces hainanensis]|uniref:CHAT domain-containing protein n=1 Tax=Streptomyces hainanensis TaxID=402648 RepID=A0A4R4TWV2_9ACTN|nr:CHAT domain-containing protein [Streptomyces hainanensis]TDC80112.1 CHAT domain-containing protein [Streptomyces hainanensis]